jgi:hypothetical protein
MKRSRTLLGALLLAGALAATLFALPTTAQANGCPLRFSQGTDGTAANPIRIDSVADLQVLTDNDTCYRSAYVFRQTADLDLTGMTWTPIGSYDDAFPGTYDDAFNGTYDGGGRTITGLAVSVGNYAGLFGATANATLRRLTLTGAHVTATNAHAGVLAGRLYTSTVEDVHVRTSTVLAPSAVPYYGYAGGLVGEAYDSTLTTISTDAAVTVAGVNAGGVAGSTVGSTLTDTTAIGAVAAGGGWAGGLIGLACQTNVTRASAAGPVNSGSAAGGGLIGIAGDVCMGSLSAAPNPTMVITDSQATGAVTGAGSVGGFAGALYDTTVVRSYATGAVTSTGGHAGGFAGELANGTITDAYARGAVTAPPGGTAAGFVAGVTQAAITRVYATGLVSGTDFSGGLFQGFGPTVCVAGQVGASCVDATSVTASFWDTQTTRQTGSLYGAGHTTAYLQAVGSYTAAGWPIVSGWSDSASSTWGICGAANGGYPYLLRQYTTTTEPCSVVPGAPTDPLATPQNERLLITWKAPASDGGSALTTYTATAKPGGRSCTVAAPKLQCLITGLDNGTPYVVSITAANKRGAGAAAKAARVAPAPPLGVGRFRQSGSTIITQIAVNGPGVLSQVGALDATRQSRRDARGLRPLCRASKSPKQAGTVTLRCTINPKQLKVGTNRIRLTTQFKAKGGGTFTRRQTFVVRGNASSATPSNVTG